jgi:hypothetical protein
MRRESVKAKLRPSRAWRIAVNIAKLQGADVWGTIRRLIRLIQTMSWRSPEFYSNRVMLGFALISIVIAMMAVAVRF